MSVHTNENMSNLNEKLKNINNNSNIEQINNNNIDNKSVLSNDSKTILSNQKDSDLNNQKNNKFYSNTKNINGDMKAKNIKQIEFKLRSDKRVTERIKSIDKNYERQRDLYQQKKNEIKGINPNNPYAQM